MADLSSTRVFGKLTVLHEAILKANAEITGDVTASSFAGDGSLLTNLNASNLASGTVPEARLPASALVGDTTYSAGTGITLSGSTFSLTDESYTSAEKTKLAGIEAGATGDQTASEIKTAYESNPNTNAFTDAEKSKLGELENFDDSAIQAELATKADTTYVNTQLDDKVDKIVSVVAGTGLSGGGTLSTNRTLNVQYGTTAGTAAQGNDSRLSNSREWTAGTVSQAEAEAGTATTRRAWTAQRVRQAIAAWWNASTFKTKLDGIEAGAQVNVGTNLGTSGTSTTRTVTSSTGSNVSLPSATTSTAGVMSASDKTKLNGIEAGATADQTKADIDALGIDADTLDGKHASAFATSAQGSLANSAVQPGDLAAVATSGSYNDLTNLPSIAAVALSPTPPASASSGDFWFDTSDGSFNIFYDDGESPQWVGLTGGDDEEFVPLTIGMTIKASQSR